MPGFLASFLFILLAEMGDKTQLLAMAFAAKYPARKVLAAVALASLLTLGLAVLTGHFLSVIVPLGLISVLASLSFIFFGLWTLRAETLDNRQGKEFRFGPVLTVGLAFFLAEMGDKTQLATISLAIEYRNMIAVLAGATLAMVAADAIGILAGLVLHKHLPEKLIRLIAAGAFVFFGFSGVRSVLRERFEAPVVWLALAALALVTATVAVRFIQQDPPWNCKEING